MMLMTGLMAGKKLVFAGMVVVVAIIYHQFAVKAAHDAGYEAGSDAVTVQWGAEKLAFAEAEKERLKAQAEKEAEIRLQHKELQHEIQTKADAALAADVRAGRLQRAFNTCANSVSSLGDAEAAARTDVESLNDELRRIHEFHVRQYAESDRTAARLNALIDWAATTD